MKKLAALLCGILCVCLFSVPVYAENGDPDITITEDGTGGSTTPQEPVSVTTETVGGIPTITKIYELPQGTDTGAYTASFEQDGNLYTKHDISQQVQAGQAHTKTVTQTETLETESDRLPDITALAAPALPYSEDGYAGQLRLDAASIVVEETGTTSYSYRVEDVREYTNLDRNDAAYIPKTVLKNGMTLALESIEWVVMGKHPVDGRMVSNLFTAVATYAGTATGSRADGYIATLTYTGEVTKTSAGTCTYTVVFRGEPLQAAGSETETGGGEEEPQAENNGKKGHSLFWWIGIVILSAACVAIGIISGVHIVRRIRDRRYEWDDDSSDYEGYTEVPELTESAAQDTRQFPQNPPQLFPQGDEFSMDDLFGEEGFFNE